MISFFYFILRRCKSKKKINSQIKIIILLTIKNLDIAPQFRAVELFFQFHRFIIVIHSNFLTILLMKVSCCLGFAFPFSCYCFSRLRLKSCTSRFFCLWFFNFFHHLSQFVNFLKIEDTFYQILI